MLLVISLVLIYAHLLILPGALVMLITAHRWRVASDGLLVIPLSLGISFYLTIALVGAGLFNRHVLVGVVLAEALALLMYRVRARDEVLAVPGVGWWWLVLASLAAFAPALWTALTHVFESGDVVLSWNRWAMDWAAGRLPRFTMSYPQLMPVTWANLYVAIGQPVENVARVLSPALAALTTLLLGGLALRQRRLDLALATLVNVLLTWRLLGVWLDDGYAETMLLFFATATLYPLLAITPTSSRANCWWAVLTSLFLVTVTAHAKQGGLFLLVMHPLLVALWLSDCPGWDRRALRRYGILFLLAVVTLVAPWYGLKHWQVLSGSERDIAAYLIAPGGWHGTQTLIDRLTLGLTRLGTALGLYTSVLLVVSLAAAALTRRFRWVIAVCILPFTVFWAVTFNYDTRNLVVIMPLVALTAGNGLATLLGGRWLDQLRLSAWAASTARGLRRLNRVAGYGLSGAAMIGLGGLALHAERLEPWQVQQMAARGVPWANAVALDLYDAGLLSGPFLTNYRWLEALPPVNRFFDRYYERQDYQRFSDPSVMFRDAGALAAYRASDPHTPRLLLLFGGVAPYLIAPTLLTDLAARDDYGVLARGDNWLLLAAEPSDAGPGRAD